MEKILHQRYYENSSSIDFQEEWFCKNINENSEGIINKYQTWHKNGQLAQILIFYKNGKEKETFYNEKGEDTTHIAKLIENFSDDNKEEDSKTVKFTKDSIVTSICAWMHALQ